MHEIVVLSGKGGTGKTSVTAALATVAAVEVVIADCDVDAANMHLLLHPENDLESVFMSGKLAHIDVQSCHQCGKCMEVCRFGAIAKKGKDFIVDAFACEGCGYCARICPNVAIELHERRSGQLFHAKTRYHQPMVHARLDAGADHSGKLVAKVKTDARILAQKNHIPFVLVDGAPGIGCPVASSLSGANLVLLVTEPTKTAFHDLKRLISLIKRSRTPMLCLINKHDLNPELAAEITNYLKTEHIDLLALLPFDRAVPMAMINQKTIAEASANYFTEFGSMWTQMKAAVSK